MFFFSFVQICSELFRCSTVHRCHNKITGLDKTPPRDHCAMTGVERPVPCEQCQAFGMAQRRSHAAKLEALQRKALEVSQGLQGLELRETHLGTPATFPGGAHMAHPNIYSIHLHLIHHEQKIHPHHHHHHHHPHNRPSSIIRHTSSIIRHPSFILMQSCFHLSSFIMLASKSRTPRGIQVQSLNTTRQMRHQILQMLVTEMLQSCKGQLHLTSRGLIYCITIITWDHIEIKYNLFKVLDSWSSLDVQPWSTTI